MEEEIYQKNSVTAVLSRLELGITNCSDSIAGLRTEFKDAHTRLHERLDAHEKDLVDLKTSEAIRDKQVKWAVGIIAFVGWALNALITWRRGV
jgi:hypothetical protein